jgi:hypothetical protein
MSDINVLFGVANSYIADIIVEDERNYLVLCGTQGKQGSCHNGYDNLDFSLYYNAENKRYEWIKMELPNLLDLLTVVFLYQLRYTEV